MDDLNWYDKPYYSLNAYFKNNYGEKCYKIAVNAGFSCPNRDGNLDNRGCIFCSAGGSGDFAVSGDYNKDSCEIKKQITEGKNKFNKSVGEKYIIYFQAYTNTYGSVDYLRKIYKDALDEDQVIGISIATRPDCLGKEIINLLDELNSYYTTKNKFIWVELGLQTIHEDTARYIRRHYPLSTYNEAVDALSQINIPYITHIILGLPGETRNMMLETVKYVCNHPVKPQGIKLQLLHVLKGTDLSVDYRNGKFKTMDMDEYIDLVITCIQNIDKDIIIHRVTGDGPKSILISPYWSTNKKVVLNKLHQRFKEKGAFQGQACLENVN